MARNNYWRIEPFIVQHTKGLLDGPEKAWCERGLDAMRRRTGDLRIMVDKYAISSLEVTIHYEKKLGAGGFAKVYRGTHNDKAVAVKVLTEGTPWAVRCDYYPLKIHSAYYLSPGARAGSERLEESVASPYPSIYWCLSHR